MCIAVESPRRIQRHSVSESEQCSAQHCCQAGQAGIKVRGAFHCQVLLRPPHPLGDYRRGAFTAFPGHLRRAKASGQLSNTETLLLDELVQVLIGLAISLICQIASSSLRQPTLNHHTSYLEHLPTPWRSIGFVGPLLSRGRERPLSCGQALSLNMPMSARNPFKRRLWR